MTVEISTNKFLDIGELREQVFDLEKSYLQLLKKVTPLLRKNNITSSETNISIFVVDLLGKKVQIEISLYDSLFKLKTKIQDKLGIPPDQQRLIFKGKQIDIDIHELNFYGINQEDNTVNLILRLRGGMYDPTSGRLDLNHLDHADQAEYRYLSKKMRYLQDAFKSMEELVQEHDIEI